MLTFDVLYVGVFKVNIWNKPVCLTHIHLYLSIVLNRVVRNSLKPLVILSHSKGLWCFQEHKWHPSPQCPIIHPFFKTTAVTIPKHQENSLANWKANLLPLTNWMTVITPDRGRTRKGASALFQTLASCCNHSLPFTCSAYWEIVYPSGALSFANFGLFLLTVLSLIFCLGKCQERIRNWGKMQTGMRHIFEELEQRLRNDNKLSSRINSDFVKALRICKFVLTFCRWGNLGLEKLSDLCKVAEIVIVRVGTHGASWERILNTKIRMERSKRFILLSLREIGKGIHARKMERSVGPEDKQFGVLSRVIKGKKKLLLQID